jgi:hypothetical protein
MDRKCIDCGAIKSVEVKEFYRWLRHNKGRDPLDYACKTCTLKRRKKHGQSHTKLFNRWKALFMRTKYSKSYVQKGIKVCPEWYDFTVFKRWAMKNGFKSELELDRIDNAGDYSPENCQWITKTENVRKIWKDRDDATIKRYLAKGNIIQHPGDDENPLAEASGSGGAFYRAQEWRQDSASSESWLA